MTQKELKLKIKELKSKVEELQRKLFQNEKIQYIIPLLNDYHECREKLATFPSELPFPEDGVNRYQTLKSKLIPLTSEWEVLQKNKLNYQNKLTTLTNDLLTISVYKVAKTILEEKQRHEERQTQIKEKE